MFLMSSSLYADAPQPFGALPSPNQLEWAEMEYYGLIHYGLNTYDQIDWGYGDADPKIFNPSNLDTDQWAEVARDSGLKGLILVAKHHDGFCLWPTKTTEYNISKSPWKDGKGDLVADFVASCKKYSLKIGIYISPWDRNHGEYGREAYIKVFFEQWRELLTLYGDEAFELWLDGANGGDGYYGGARETRAIPSDDYYQYDKLFAMIDELAPKAVIFGGFNENSIRWVGNEAGYAAPTNWSTYSKGSSHVSLLEFKTRETGIKGGKYWLPAEADTTLLLPKKWFYNERSKPRNLENYTDLYYTSIGRNASLNIGLAIGPDGLLPKADADSMLAVKKQLDKDFAVDLIQDSTLSISNTRNENPFYTVDNLRDMELETYWASDDGVNEATIEVEFPQKESFNRLLLQENIAIGQRVTSLKLECLTDSGRWEVIVEGTTIGFKRILRFGTVTAQRVKVTLKTDAPCLTLSKIAMFNAPEILSPPTISRNYFGRVRIAGGLGYKLYYAIDDESFKPYKKRFSLKGSGKVRAMTYHVPTKTQTDEVEFIFGNLASQWVIVDFSSQLSLKHRVRKALDGKENTFWSTKPGDGVDAFIVLDTKKSQEMTGFYYLPRQDESRDGTVERFQFFLSSDGENWNLISEGRFNNIINNPTRQMIFFDTPVEARYIKFVAKATNGDLATFAELGIFTLY